MIGRSKKIGIFASVGTDMKIEINKERIDYLLALYKMSENDLLSLLNESRKRSLEMDQINGDMIDLSLLKRIDKIFGEGLSFYQDFSLLSQNASNSIFFRKSKFGAELNRESIRIVHRFENLKQALDAYNKLSRLQIKSDIWNCTINDNPKEIAIKARAVFYPGNIKDARKFLVDFIGKCADHGIFVFEYIETWNKKEKTNIDGFYLESNMIVLKHHKHYKREIFTLAHELGHCFLGKEEVESVDMMSIDQRTEYNAVEKWCNDFAYQFIMGEDANMLVHIDKVDSVNDYYFDYITSLSSKMHISRLALFTRLYLDKKISYANYNKIRNELTEAYKIGQEQEKKKNVEKKYGISPKPIISPLFLRTMQHAYFKGVVNEDTFCLRLSIKSNKFEKVLWQ
ncbi:MAG: ImmA/IrrE family metallo-endopeptidase [Bacteroidaceae bacterium]|nr:ImmA/IrrE family metallo-endopeptidase [Bacteroidaceae bacterium]